MTRARNLSDVAGITYLTATGNKVGIGSTIPQSTLDVAGSATFSGIVTASSFSGSFSGNATTASYADNAGIATYATSAGIATYADTAGVSTNVSGGTASVTSLNVSGVSTFQNGYKVTGGNSYYSDDVRLYFGNDSDIFIGHQTIPSPINYIAGANNIPLTIWSDNLTLGAQNGENFATFTTNGSASLYHDNSKKFETLGTGVTVTGTTFTNQLNVSGISTFIDDVKISEGSSLDFGSGAGDLHIYRQSGGSSDSIIKYDGSYNFKILSDITTLASSAGSVTWGVFGNNGVELYYGNSKKFETLGAGVTVTGTTFTNQLSVSGVVTASTFSGSGASITNLDASNLSTGTVPSARITSTSPLTVNGDLYVAGNISFGGTTTQLNTTQVTFSDPDIVLGVGTTSTFNPTDSTANHGGIAIASTEGFPLVNLNISPVEILPTTYKKIMWFKNNAAGLGTDAWLSNFAVGIGSTQFPTGTRFASGTIQFGESDINVVRNINSSGVVTATTFSGSGASLTGVPVSTGISGLGANVDTFLATPSSSNLAAAVTDETGSGALVFATSPSLTTPDIGAATATSINKVAITAPATSATLTIANGKTLTASNTLTFTGTDSSSVAFGSGGTVAYTGGTLAQFSATTSSQLAGVISDETGSGALVFATSPTLTTPNIGVATGTSLSVSGQLTSTVATGTAPLVVSSTTVVTNLNADLLDGLNGSAFVRTDTSSTITGKLHISREGASECCSSGNYTLSLAENTSVSGTLARIQFHNSGVSEGYIALAGSGSRRMYFGDNQAVTMGIECTGSITAAGNVTAYSDITLKENVETISDALYKVTQLRGVEFDRKDLPNKPHQIGVIAQEIEKVIPEVVHEEEGVKSVSYGNLVGLLIEAIKEQQEQINTLKSEIEELKK